MLPSCTTALGSSTGCTGEALEPYLEHDIFVFVDQSDNVIAPLQNFNAEQVRLYKQILRESLKNVSGAASTDLGLHGTVSNMPFNELVINGIRYRDIIANWFFDRSGPKKVIVE